MFKKLKPFEAFSIAQFKDPDTGHIYQADKIQQLYVDIIQYRVQNNLESLENLPDVVENYMCGLPENCNKCNGAELHRTLYQYVKGGVALLKNLYFQKFVTQDVAEKRAMQCQRCEFNVFPDKGPFLGFADDLAIMQVGERKVSEPDKLGSCEVCSCSLRSKVFFDGVLPKATEEEAQKFRKVSCWQIGLLAK